MATSNSGRFSTFKVVSFKGAGVLTGMLWFSAKIWTGVLLMICLRPAGRGGALTTSLRLIPEPVRDLRTVSEFSEDPKNAQLMGLLMKSIISRLSALRPIDLKHLNPYSKNNRDPSLVIVQ